MINEPQFISAYDSHKLKYPFRDIINRQIKLVNFDGVRQYRHGVVGIEILKNQRWFWCWMNSINTNYSTIFQIVDFINQKEPRKLTIFDFRSDNINNTLLYIEECIGKYRQEIFTPGSLVFKKMYFAAQWSWNRGIISTINCILTLKTRYNIKCDNLNFERGGEDDMKRGTDMLLFFEGEFRTTQHKSSKIEEFGDVYISKNIKYDEHTYRKNLDLITIECDKKIYIFRNSKNIEDGLCGTNKLNQFFISKKLLIDVIDLQNIDMSNLLDNLNNTYRNQNIVFDITNNNESLNYFKEDKNAITLFLNNINDDNLLNLLKNKSENLQESFQ